MSNWQITLMFTLLCLAVGASSRDREPIAAWIFALVAIELAIATVVLFCLEYVW